MQTGAFHFQLEGQPASAAKQLIDAGSGVLHAHPWGSAERTTGMFGPGLRYYLTDYWHAISIQ
jgi:hypothetical protein